MRRLQICGGIVLLCMALTTGAPPLIAHMDLGPALQTTLVNFDGAGNQIVRFDTQGNAVDAHEGQIALFGNTYYFYGTGYGCGFREFHDTPFCGFDVYSSTDLVHWVNQGTVFDATTDYWQTLCGHGAGCYRPHVVYNAGTGKYVLWFSSANASSGYVVMESPSPAGPFTQRPAPYLAVDDDSAAGQSYQGDESLFVDVDGTAYLIHTDWRRQGDMVIEQLDPTYETATGRYVRLQLNHNEAPTMFKRNGLYYVMTSDPNCAWCNATGTGYLTAATPLGPWMGPDPLPAPYWQVSGGTLLANGGGAGFSIPAPGQTWSDYTFSFDTQPLTTTDGRYAQSGWLFRAENESGPSYSQLGGYIWSLSNNPALGAAGGALVKTIEQNGQAVSQTVTLPFSVTATTWYHVTTTDVGGTITTTVNGQIVDVTHDSTYTQGRVGFIESTTNGESALFRNVSVTAANGTPLLSDDFSRFDAPLAARPAFTISTTSCGGQPADVVPLPGSNETIYLYLSDLWSNGDMPGLGNYYMGPLSFNGDGSIQSLSCQTTVPLSLTVGSPGQQDTPPDLDQSSGYDGFQTQCDIGASTMRLQTFTPSRSGTITRLSAASFNWYIGSAAPLVLDVVTIDANGQPTSTLSSTTVPPTEIDTAARGVVIDPYVSVVGGRHYGILIHSATYYGCYGDAYNDNNPYAGGEELVSTDGGATFQAEPTRDLQFTVSVSPTAPTPTTTDAPTASDTPAPATNTPTFFATPSPINTKALIATPTTVSTSTPTTTFMNTPTMNAPTATNTPTAATATLEPTVAIPTATSRESAPVATRMKKTKKPAKTPLPLTVHVSPTVVRSGGRLLIVVHTAPRVRLELTLRITTSRVVTVRHGAHRRRYTRSIVLYGIARRGIAGTYGRFTATLKVTYRPAKPLHARVTVITHVGDKTATWNTQIVLEPPTKSRQHLHRHTVHAPGGKQR